MLASFALAARTRVREGSWTGRTSSSRRWKCPGTAGSSPICSLHSQEGRHEPDVASIQHDEPGRAGGGERHHAGPGPKRAGARPGADAVRVRQREPLRHHGSPRRLRRRAGGRPAQPLRRSLPLARQPARARSRGWPRATRYLPTGSPTRSSCAGAPSSTTAPRSPPRTCATASSASWPSRRARRRSSRPWWRRAPPRPSIATPSSSP